MKLTRYDKPIGRCQGSTLFDPDEDAPHQRVIDRRKAGWTFREAIGGRYR